MTKTSKTSVAKSAMFSVAMRWLSRLIGIVSTLILARLLAPDDFGVTAMASMVLGLASVMLDIGVNIALIRNPNATVAHYHSAWTLRMIQAVVITALLLIAAPFAGEYFRDPRVVPVVMILALNVTIGSFENIGVVTFQKEMQFGLEFRYLLTNRIFGFIVTVCAAFAFRNYWALVLAGAASQLFAVFNSYRAHPMRPRFSKEKIREILSVSQWIFFQNIGGYLDNTLHRLLVGRRDSTSVMGAYSLADGVASMPSSELMQPLNRVLFPAFVAVKSNLLELKRMFLLAQGLQVLIALPAAIFMALLAADLVPVLLGAKWMSAVPLLQSLALGSALLSIRSSAWYVSVTLGRERWCALVVWSQVIIFVLLCLAIFPDAQANQIADFRVLVPMIGLVLQLLICANALGNLSLSDLLHSVWRPITAIICTTAILWSLPVINLPLPLVLIVKCVICLVSYGGCVMLFWRLSGLPDGAERYLWVRACAAFESIKRRYS
jgi:lipopolysaccharide exporter